MRDLSPDNSRALQRRVCEITFQRGAEPIDLLMSVDSEARVRIAAVNLRVRTRDTGLRVERYIDVASHGAAVGP
jgi:hypothetical protein